MTWPEIRRDLEKYPATHLTTDKLARAYGLTTKQMKNLLDHYGFIPGVDYQRAKPGPKGPRA